MRRLLVICLVFGLLINLPALAVSPMPKQRPIEVMPKPGFDQKGWTYQYTWTGSNYRIDLRAPDGQHYRSTDSFETMAAGYEWVKQFITNEVPFRTLPQGIEVVQGD